MKKIIAIRKETKDKTQKRTPLVPEHVKYLIDEHKITVLVEPWENRIFTDKEYKSAGAILTDDLSSANIIFGIKEVAPELILPNKAYCFFSHTVKGQSYNMKMLKTILDKSGSLLDYELVKDAQGRRIIFFGEYAGLAGTIDTIWALGQRLKSEGITNPFSAIKYATAYKHLFDARAAFLEASHKISEKGLPKEITPLIIGVTGTGHVTKGALSLFDLFPTVTLQPEELTAFMKRGVFSNRAIYKVEFQKHHLYRPIDKTKPFNLKEFSANPHLYTGALQQYLPLLTALIHGIYWEPKFPKLVTKKYISTLFNAEKQPRLRVIGDITCDIEGSIEINLEETNSDNPVYVYDVRDKKIHYGVTGKGPVVLAVDKLPTELPYEASVSFGNALLQYVPSLASASFNTGIISINIPQEFRRAIIAQNGKLRPEFGYLQQYIKD